MKAEIAELKGENQAKDVETAKRKKRVRDMGNEVGYWKGKVQDSDAEITFLNEYKAETGSDSHWCTASVFRQRCFSYSKE